MHIRENIFLFYFYFYLFIYLFFGEIFSKAFSKNIFFENVIIVMKRLQINLFYFIYFLFLMYRLYLNFKTREKYWESLYHWNVKSLIFKVYHLVSTMKRNTINATFEYFNKKKFVIQKKIHCICLYKKLTATKIMPQKSKGSNS